MKKDIKKYLSEIGSKGGKAGTGKAKRRPPEHYQMLAEKRKAKKESV